MSHIDLTEILLKTLLKNFTYSINNYSDVKNTRHTWIVLTGIIQTEKLVDKPSNSNRGRFDSSLNPQCCSILTSELKNQSTVQCVCVCV